MIDCVIDCDDKVFPMVPAGAPIEDTFDQDDLNKECINSVLQAVFPELGKKA